MSSDVAVIIASYRRPQVLAETLESLSRQTLAGFQIILSLTSADDCFDSAPLRAHKGTLPWREAMTNHAAKVVVSCAATWQVTSGSIVAEDWRAIGWLFADWWLGESRRSKLTICRTATSCRARHPRRARSRSPADK